MHFSNCKALQKSPQPEQLKITTRIAHKTQKPIKGCYCCCCLAAACCFCDECQKVCYTFATASRSRTISSSSRIRSRKQNSATHSSILLNCHLPFVVTLAPTTVVCNCLLFSISRHKPTPCYPDPPTHSDCNIKKRKEGNTRGIFLPSFSIISFPLFGINFCAVAKVKLFCYFLCLLQVFFHFFYLCICCF